MVNLRFTINNFASQSEIASQKSGENHDVIHTNRSLALKKTSAADPKCLPSHLTETIFATIHMTAVTWIVAICLWLLAFDCKCRTGKSALP